MIKIEITGDTPLETLASLTAFGMHCLQNEDVYAAANRILEAEQHDTRKAASAPTPTVAEVRQRGIEASRKYGKEAIVAILQKFNVSGMSAIEEKDRAAFIAKLDELDVDSEKAGDPNA